MMHNVDVCFDVYLDLYLIPSDLSDSVTLADSVYCILYTVYCIYIIYTKETKNTPRKSTNKDFRQKIALVRLFLRQSG